MAPTNVFKALEALAAGKEAIRQREEKIVAGLQEILGRLGYGLERVGANGAGCRATQRRRRPIVVGRQTLTCSECGRVFALPLHLGRHVSAAHRGGPAVVQTAVTTPGKGSDTAPGGKPKARRRKRAAVRRAAAGRMKRATRARKTARPGRVRAAAQGRRATAKAARQRAQRRGTASAPQQTAAA